VQICSGDICGRPSNYDLDDDIKVELRDKAGTTTLDSKKVGTEMRDRMCTTKAGTKVPCNSTERRFCFEGKRDGKYQLAFILFKEGNWKTAPVDCQECNRQLWPIACQWAITAQRRRLLWRAAPPLPSGYILSGLIRKID